MVCTVEEKGRVNPPRAGVTALQRMVTVSLSGQEKTGQWSAGKQGKHACSGRNSAPGKSNSRCRWGCSRGSREAGVADKPAKAKAAETRSETSGWMTRPCGSLIPLEGFQMKSARSDPHLNECSLAAVFRTDQRRRRVEASRPVTRGCSSPWRDDVMRLLPFLRDLGKYEMAPQEQSSLIHFLVYFL